MSCRHATSFSPIIRVLRAGLCMVENEETEARARLKVLRDAARIGIADVEAGRFRTFESSSQVSRRLAAVADEVIAEGRSAGAVR